jgi:hypothetical protein
MPYSINAAAKAMRRYPVNSDKQQAIGRTLSEANAWGQEVG